MDFASAKRERRSEKALEATADAHWATRTCVRCFQALSTAVHMRWDVWRLHGMAKRMLAAWREVAEEAAGEPGSRQALRRRLR